MNQRNESPDKKNEPRVSSDEIEHEIAKFIIQTLKDPRTKKSPAMVAAIAGLYRVLI